MSSGTGSLFTGLRPVGEAALFALVAAVSIAIVVFLVGEFRLAVASEGWIAVAGTVDSSGVRHTGRTRLADVRYRYEVGGAELTGSRVRFLESVGLEFASTTAERYPAGGSVRVYHDPSDPRESVLEPGRRAGAFVVAGLCDALLLVVAVVAAVAAIRKASGGVS